MKPRRIINKRVNIKKEYAVNVEYKGMPDNVFDQALNDLVGKRFTECGYITHMKSCFVTWYFNSKIKAEQAQVKLADQARLISNTVHVVDM